MGKLGRFENYDPYRSIAICNPKTKAMLQTGSLVLGLCTPAKKSVSFLSSSTVTTPKVTD
jgi:hypothetical protein